MSEPGELAGDSVDTYWDPYLSRCNLADPALSDIERRSGLDRLVGAGRVITNAPGGRGVCCWLLTGLARRDERPVLLLDRADVPTYAEMPGVGEPVNVSWCHADTWWGGRAHVVRSARGKMVLQRPITVYAFPVRDRLWSSPERLAPMFRGFDTTFDLLEAQDPVGTNHEARVLDYLNQAMLDRRPALVYVPAVDTVFAGRFGMGEGQGRPPLSRAPALLDFVVAGTDLVGVGWRSGYEVAASLLVGGDTVRFRSQTAGGRDTRVQVRWPKELFVCQRRRVPRIPLGATNLVDFEIPLTSPLGVSAGTARPVRVLDIGIGGVALVFDNKVAAEIGPRIETCTTVLYGKTRLPVTIEVLERVRFGAQHTRYCCAFRGLDPMQRRALERLLLKLGG